MTKTATRPGPAPKPPAAATPPKKPKPEKPKESFRDFVEQIVVAIILALLIRGFDAEAFVIPTGSMAPTLKGRHKEIACPQCGSVYSVNSTEDSEAHLIANPSERPKEMGICVNCRHLAPIGDAPSFKGDRILVMKFPYEFPFLPGSGGPKRHDVVVFHYPERPEQNYIKRLLGLPGEDLRVRRGDIQVRPSGTDEPFTYARKSLSKMQAMAILINDDNHRATLLKDHPEWLRWRTSDGWSETKEGVFTVSAEKGGSLRYRHLVPDPEQWIAIGRNQPLARAPRPTLITDFYSYNASTMADPEHPDTAWLQSDWVGDLLLDFDLNVKSSEGQVTVELVEAGVKNRCVIDIATGTATLFHGETKLGEAPTRLKGPGSYSVGFANVDDRLTLTVNGRAPFDDGLAYDDGPAAPNGPTAGDLDPVGISTTGATVEVSGLVLKRDIYYTQDPRHPDVSIPGPTAEWGRPQGGFSRVINMFDVLSDPAKFTTILGGLEPGVTYTIKPDHFLMMGDNSPRSADSRAWRREDRDWDPGDRARHEVPREMLIGKAFFVYWPHGVPFGPDIRLSRDFRVPFRPNFERMRPIR